MKSLSLSFLSLAVLVGITLTSSAKETVMYKKVDKDGKVVFTDKPIPGSKAVTIKTDVNVVKTPKPTFRKPSTDKPDDSEKKPFQYKMLAIDTPKDDEGIRANDGNVNVVIAITPNLQEGHSVQLRLDGNDTGQPQKIPYFSLSGVERGTHQLQAVVINDGSGDVVQSSDSISFHALIASRLNQNRRNKR